MRFVHLVAVLAVVLSPFIAHAQTNSRTYVIFVDDLHIPFRKSPQLRRVMQQVARELASDGNKWAMVSTGASSVSVPPTSDWSALNAQIARLTGGALYPADVVGTRTDTNATVEVQRRAAITSATLFDVVETATRVEAREIILYIGSAGTGMAVTNPTAIANASRQAAIPIYSIDLHDRSDEPPSNVPLTEWNEHVSSTAAALRMLADGSRGISAVEGDGLDSMLRQLRTAPIPRP